MDKQLRVAFRQAQLGLHEGGIPIGAALLDNSGKVLGEGRNRRIQDNDPSAHGETDAFRRAGRITDYRDKIMVTTLAPCWYCSGLIVQFKIGHVIVGEAKNFTGGIDWLSDRGVKITVLDSPECIDMMSRFIIDHPALWSEDIAEADNRAEAANRAQPLSPP